MVRNRVRKAFSFGEILIALGLISIALLALIGVYIGALRLQAKSEDLLVATELAEEMMKAIRIEGRGLIPDAPSTFDGNSPNGDPFPPAPYPGVTRNGKQFIIVVETESLPPRLKRVRVEIRWDSHSKITLEGLVRG